LHLAQIIQSLNASEVDALMQQPLIPHYLAEAFITMPKKRVN
jgi:hypothetical protein